MIQPIFAVYVCGNGQGSFLFAYAVRSPEQIGVGHFIFDHCLPQESLGFSMTYERCKTKIRRFHWP